MVALVLLFARVAGAAPPDTAAEPGDTGVGIAPPAETADTGAPPPPEDTGLDLDRDGDGWTPREGDCDDDERNAYPGLAEVCTDRIDNDCDGLYDEGCDDSARFASLRGGGGCTGNSALTGDQAALPAAFALLLWSFWWRRRR